MSNVNYSEDLGHHYQYAIAGMALLRQKLRAAQLSEGDPVIQGALKSQIIEDIEQTDKAFTRAGWESAVDFAAAEHASHPLLIRRAEYRALRAAAIAELNLTVSLKYWS